MNDRFKFRIALHQDKYEEYGLEKFKNQRIFEVKTLNVGYENSTVEIIADYPNGDWAVREIDEDDVEIMQCTGLKDKNGTLIYEGDIVRIYNKIYEVIFDVRTAYFGLKISNVETATLNNIDTQTTEIEVIGNIYKNPELLKQDA